MHVTMWAAMHRTVSLNAGGDLAYLVRSTLSLLLPAYTAMVKEVKGSRKAASVHFDNLFKKLLSLSEDRHQISANLGMLGTKFHELKRDKASLQQWAVLGHALRRKHRFVEIIK